MSQHAAFTIPSSSLKFSENPTDNEGPTTVKHAIDGLLSKLGYQGIFKREWFSVSIVYRTLPEEISEYVALNLSCYMTVSC